MAAKKQKYLVLQAFGMGDKKFEPGQEVELYPMHTKTLIDNGAIKLVEGSDQPSPKTPKPEAPSTDQSAIIKQLMDQMTEMKATQDMFMQVADKKLLAQYYAKNQKKMPKEFRLNTINDKVIVLFRDMPVNNVAKNPATKQWFEDQHVEMVLEDDSVVKMTYQAYVTSYKQVVAKVISTTIDEMTEEPILKLVRIDNGMEYNINVKYLN